MIPTHQSTSILYYIIPLPSLPFPSFLLPLIDDCVSILDLEVFNGIDDDILGSFEHFPSDDDLIQNSVHLVKVKDDVQLAHIPEVLIEVLHK